MPLVGDSVNFWPLVEVVRGDQEISVSPVALPERPSDVNCDPLEGCPDVVVVNQVATSSSTRR
jgi:hypothetical protein